MSPARAGAVLLLVGVVGMTCTLLAAIAGWRLLDRIGGTLDDGADIAAETVAAAQSSLAGAEATTRQLDGTLGDAEALLAATADLSEDRVAVSIAAVNDALPALIDVAAVIDRTLTTLAAVPFGPDYSPDEPFDASLRRLQTELAGLPEDLRAQAELIRGAGTNLAAARSGVTSVADDLGALRAVLRSTSEMLESLALAPGAQDARVGDVGTGELAGAMRLGRVLVLGLAATAATANVVPLLLGWMLLRPGSAGLVLTRAQPPPTA